MAITWEITNLSSTLSSASPERWQAVSSVQREYGAGQGTYICAQMLGIDNEVDNYTRRPLYLLYSAGSATNWTTELVYSNTCPLSASFTQYHYLGSGFLALDNNGSPAVVLADSTACLPLSASTTNTEVFYLYRTSGSWQKETIAASFPRAFSTRNTGAVALFYDTSNCPHVLYSDYSASSSYQYIWYTKRVSGVWQTASAFATSWYAAVVGYQGLVYIQ